MNTMKKRKNTSWKIQPKRLSPVGNNCETWGVANENHSRKNCKERVINFKDFPS